MHCNIQNRRKSVTKFVLIDHSIVKTGGHYLEYAQNVLKSIDKDYDIWIATNKLFKEVETLKQYHILPIYQYDIWGRVPESVTKKSSCVHRIKKGIKDVTEKIKFRISFLLNFSYVGLFRRGIETGHFFASENTLLSLPMLIGAFLAAIICFAPFMVFKVFSKILRLVWKKAIKRYWIMSGKILKQINILDTAENEKVSKAFASGTIKMLRKANIKEGDIVFIPTLSLNDLKGIYNVIKNKPQASKCSWHLLFRRNVFNGREPEYSEQITLQVDYQRVFAEISRFSNVYFYTDTETLSRQYTRLTGLQFCTLPIPIFSGFQDGEFTNICKPYKLIYAGDARSEKGYQYIPDIAEKLYQELENGEISFDLQSNFTFAKASDDAAVVAARRRLQEYPFEQVALRNNAMRTSEYCDFVKKAAIGLFLYDRNNYYARSSGALVECLASGCPVIVPSASWLSDQIMPSIVDYQVALANRMEKDVVFSASESEWFAGGIGEKLIAHIGFLTEPRENRERIRRLNQLFEGKLEEDGKSFYNEFERFKAQDKVEWLLYAEKLLNRDEPCTRAIPSNELSIHANGKAKFIRVTPECRAVYMRYRLDDLVSHGIYIRTQFIFYDINCHELGRCSTDNARVR